MSLAAPTWHGARAYPTFFLPVDVPSSARGPDEGESVLHCLAQFQWPRLGTPDSAWAHMETALRRFVQLHQGEIQGVAHSLSQTHVGESWGLWVGAQNAVVLVVREAPDAALVLAWELQCSNDAVTGSTGWPVQLLPRSGVRAPWARVQECGEMLQDLAVRPQRRALPKSTKAGINCQETRDVTNPLYVLDVLLASLGGTPLAEAELAWGVRKKMRDEVRYAGGELPWRRAPVWAAVKSMLHVICLREKGSDALYKMLVACLLAHALQGVAEGHDSVVPAEVSLSALKEGSMKLVRRLAKVRGQMPSELYCKAEQPALRAARQAMAVVEADWSRRCATTADCSVQVSAAQLAADTKHTVPKSGAILRKLVDLSDGDVSDGSGPQPVEVGVPEGGARLRTWSIFSPSDVRRQLEILKTVSIERDPQHLVAVLHDIAEGAMDGFCDFQDADDPDVLAPALLQLSSELAQCGLQAFPQDVRGLGSVILTAATLVALLDKIACAAHPLLREHRSGIATSFLEELFLPTALQRQHLRALEAYLLERNRAAYPPTQCRFTNDRSFSVRFAASCSDMQRALGEIQRRCEDSKVAKREEKRVEQARYDELMQRVRSMSCRCVWVPTSRGGFMSGCDRCSYQRQADSIKIMYYECLLPPGETEQLAVVYELRQPDALACQRDAGVHFAEIVCKESWQETDRQWIGFWENESRLAEWRRQVASRTIKLGSHRKKLSQSHYGSPQHVSTDPDFIIRHDYHAHPMGSIGRLLDIEDWHWDVRPHCCVKASHPELGTDARYANLERIFNSRTHSENDILALKSEASEKLSLREFEECGILRAGVKLQLVRLAAGLAQRTFTLERAEIANLLCCVLWQVGPRSDCWRRQGCELVRTMPTLTEDICRTLGEILEGCSQNWSKHVVLLNVVHVAQTLSEHAVGDALAQSAAAGVLRKCRDVAHTWIGDLVRTSNESQGDAEMQALHAKIADVAAIGTLTFADSDALLFSDQDVGIWVLFRAVFYKDYSPNEIKQATWRRDLLLHAMARAEAVAPRIARLLGGLHGRNGLRVFLELYWSGASRGTTGTWAPYQDAGAWGWYHTMFVLDDEQNTQVTLQVDVVGGSFLVDGKPCERLPKNIVTHKVYQRLFGNAIFEVQPLGNGGYRSSVEIRGFFYEFYPGDFNPSLGFAGAPLIVKEKLGQFRALLVPDALLGGDFPEILVACHSHWFVLWIGWAVGSIKRGCLRFRPVEYVDLKFGEFGRDEFVLDCVSWKLAEQGTNAHLLDVHSSSFSKFYANVFWRLSPARFIHVFVPGSAATKATVRLPRLQLGFDYNGEHLVSQDFRGLRVDLEQRSGTLMGLKNALLLSEPSGTANRTLVCPNGEVRSQDRATTTIDIEALRAPPVFQYELRPELQDVWSGSKSRLSWLFLALLHARTSGLQPDPFTCCTGTERAFAILRSGHCCGNLLTMTDEDLLRRALRPELDLLLEIACVSPRRRDYHSMERNDIGPAFGGLTAHPAFAFVARARISAIGDALDQIGCKVAADISTPVPEERTSHLCRRAYFQRREYYPKDAGITAEEEEKYFQCRHTDVGPTKYTPSSGFSKSACNRAQRIAASAQNGPDAALKCQESFEDLLCHSSELAGRDPVLRLAGTTGKYFASLVDSGRVKKEEQHNRDLPEFKHLWLNLYATALNDVRSEEAVVHFGTLLAWLAAEYDSEMCLRHLHQLHIVALHPQRFPEPPPHAQYIETSEDCYHGHHVERAVLQHLEAFTEAEPAAIYHVDHTAWRNRRELHNSQVSTTKAALLAKIRQLYDLGRSVSSGDTRVNKIGDPQGLAMKLQALFDRWRRARELTSFLQSVTRALRPLQEPLAPLAAAVAMRPFSRCVAADWKSERHEFFLVTEGTSTEPVTVTAAIRQMGASGQFPEAFTYAVATARAGRGQGAVLDFDEEFVHESPEYGPLWERLTSQLRHSWTLAEDDVDEDLACFEDPARVERLRLELEAYWQSARDEMDEVWGQIQAWLADPSAEAQQHMVGLWSSVAPYKLLARYFQQRDDADTLVEDPLGPLVAALAVCVKHVQRARRCLRQLRACSAAFPRLAHDLASAGCEGWRPDEHPEFLAFELDNDVCVRGVQARVALAILAGDQGNRLLQLNMGGGKTAVIMPLVLCTAARGDCIVRATVLSSLYTVNAVDWQSKVGGLLGRRIFPLMCHRGMLLGESQASRLLGMLRQVKQGRDIIVTVPEHRLSLENKALELASRDSLRSDEPSSALLLQGIDWLAREARDFLDESDELLSPKYQLIYALGAPQDMDGNLLRWKVHAGVMQSVTFHAMELRDEFGADVVEIVTWADPADSADASAGFIGVRLLESHLADRAYNRLCELVELDMRANVVPRDLPIILRMRPGEERVWSQCVRGEDVEGDEVDALPQMLRVSALCLRGLLAHGVLRLALQKRFRVQYGAHPTRAGYQMAVPFRAKDVAMESTEFSHPDVALLLTFATYYQAGLSEGQLRDVFVRLAQLSECEAKCTYRAWSARLTPEFVTIKEYDCVNLDDPALFRDKLFPAFRRHMGVVDFWLFKVILPVQAKQFPKKLTATAGDLCRSDDLVPSWSAITTGFSGTDDLRFVLPPTVLQRNLDELEKTNGTQLRSILRPENDCYQHLRGEGANSTDEILALLEEPTAVNERTNVVLDAGALVLHMCNLEFARAWLARRPDMQAAVYFQGDTVWVVSRYAVDPMPLQHSPFADGMGQCLLYLDDVHTRGSDFCLPLSTRALLTLGRDLPKDKLVQACMRMRQLGKGQALTFVASPEVHGQLRAAGASSRITARRILSWALANTVKRICDLFPYCGDQAASCLRKAKAFAEHFYGELPAPAALAHACTEKEVLDLKCLYEHVRHLTLLPEIVAHKLATVPVPHGVAGRVLERAREVAPDVRRHNSMFDEEQERELEAELEEEVHRERPPPAEPFVAAVSPELQALATRTHAPASAGELLELGFWTFEQLFDETSLRAAIRGQLQQTDVIFTSDFARCVKGGGDKDAYMKRFRWGIMMPSSQLVIIISNFEAEHFASWLVRSGDGEGRLPQDAFTTPQWLQHFASCLVRSGDGEGRLPLHVFTALQWLGQPRRCLTFASMDAPAAVHVFGGSLQAEGELLEELRRFLALCPRPRHDAAEWDEHFAQCRIEPDGFVRREHRSIVGAGDLARSPFAHSPVKLLAHFLSNVRHMAEELPTSALGRLLGVSDTVQ